MPRRSKPSDPVGPSPEGRDLRTPHGRLQYLEELLPSVPATVKGKIVELIGEIAASLGAGAGPPDPLTPSERVERYVRLMEVGSQEEVDEAYGRVFGGRAETPSGDSLPQLPRRGDRRDDGEDGAALGLQALQEPPPPVAEEGEVPEVRGGGGDVGDSLEVIIDPILELGSGGLTQSTPDSTQNMVKPPAPDLTKAVKWSKEHLDPTHQEKVSDLWKDS